ncbi:MAG: efflux RND transporter periplasmic adaptor subunit [Kofleriaceae bacterium]|nr:efflux RND transporter periplasmic adaptor subunit [Kofleriaceae bacterium]
MVTLLASFAFGCGDHQQPSEGEEEPEIAEESRAIERSPEELSRFGVEFGSAGPGEVDLGLELPGEIQPNADRVAHIAPRFSGIVREVRKRVGDSVRPGEVLAVVESETLAPFELKSAFAGTVIEKTATPGEAIGRETTAFVVADLATVWATFTVYQPDLAFIRRGQTIRIHESPGQPAAEGTISYITPVVDPTTRAASARVVLPNPEGGWRPGAFITGYVVDPVPAAVAAPRAALQTVDGQSVVFTAEGDRVTPRTVSVGRAGRTIVEITSGLEPGERYAVAGTFLLKAELGKSEAEEEE